MDPNSVRLLLIEDDADDADLILEALGAQQATDARIDWVSSLDEAFKVLEQDRFDVILTDLNLGPTFGIETLTTLRERRPDLPIMVLSGVDDTETALRAMKLGAQDFLVKDQISRELLARSIAYAIERHRIDQALRRQSDELRGYTYAITHDLKTPLISLDYLLEEVRDHLERGEPAEVIVPTLDAMSARIAGMEELIQDINVLASADEGEPDEWVQLSSLVRDALDEHANAIRRRGLQVQVDIPDMPRIHGNRVQLRQLMANLVGNAVKYTRAEGGLVHIAARPLNDEPHTAWRVEVEDDGPGVPPEHRDRIFKAFVRAPDPLHRNIQGNGIGLAICAKVAHNHGTGIHVREAPTGGALFYFDIPPGRLAPRSGGPPVPAALRARSDAVLPPSAERMK